MGVRQRVVRQTITEVICDFCKKPVEEDSAHVGTLSVKPSGARGRPRQLEVAFHAECYRRISDSALKSRSSAKTSRKKTTSTGKKRAKRSPAGRKKTARAGAKKTTSAEAGAKKAAKRSTRRGRKSKAGRKAQDAASAS